MPSRNFLFGLHSLVLSSFLLHHAEATPSHHGRPSGRQRLSLNDGWKFWRSETNPDGVIYDWRPDLKNLTDVEVLKPFILPSGNDFIRDPERRHERPHSGPYREVNYTSPSFDDEEWEDVTLSHDWAIKGPFYTGPESTNPVNGGMGRLPVQGVGWYRKKLYFTKQDQGKNLYLEIDGSMSYTMVWLNDHLIGGWPYGYNSFRLDLTPYLRYGSENQLSIRLDNPLDSARWYPGGGIYRNVWLTKVNPIHVAQYGTYITSRDVSMESATLDLTVQVESTTDVSKRLEAVTDVHRFDYRSGKAAAKVASFPLTKTIVAGKEKRNFNTSTTLSKPDLWKPLPEKEPGLYVAVTRLYDGRRLIDSYETTFGVRGLQYSPNQGLLVNGQLVKLQGVNQHHDLGALGAAWNTRAAERQLEILQELGCNAIRMSHNPPAPELLELTDRMGFLVIDEIFDTWRYNKTAGDFHLIFDDWHEPDLRNFIRRDRNHPSVIAWSYGNEVYEQYTNETGAALSASLRDIVREEDPSRQSTASMNYATPEMDFPEPLEILSLNYQGAGIRDIPGYPITGIVRPPSYPLYHEAFPDKMILSSESASTLSTRGTYIFPVTDAISAPANGTTGEGADETTAEVSAYELYTAGFGSSPDKVFASQDKAPYPAGEFVWTGWDYIGEPTPFYSARSSYSGIIDLAGFKKDRFYLYQSRWRPDLRFAHIIPHWTWPERVGEITPVHVFSSADEAELFVNGVSQGRLKKKPYEYRFRWHEVIYQPGELHVKTYKNGSFWAESTVRTVGEPAALRASADRATIVGNGLDLSFITVEVVEENGDVVPRANNTIKFSVDGPGEIVATDNGDPIDFTPFPSATRDAYSGLALGIFRAKSSNGGIVEVTVSSEGLHDAKLELHVA